MTSNLYEYHENLPEDAKKRYEEKLKLIAKNYFALYKHSEKQ